MNKNRELAKNTAYITIGKICTQFMSFFLMPLYTSALSTQEYGIVDLIVTYTSLFLPVVLFQVDQALFRFLVDVRRDDEGKKKIITVACSFAIFQSLFVLLIFSLIHTFINVPYKWFLLFNILTSVISNMMLQVSRGLGDNITYALGSVVSASAQIIGNIVLILFFKMGVYGMLYATVVSHLVTGFFVFFRVHLYRFFDIRQFSLVKLKEILRYAFPLIPNQLCWWLLNASDRTIVLFFLGTSSNGLLSVGHKFSSAFITLCNTFNLSWTESAALHINDNDRDEFFTDIITRMFKLFMCASLGIIACMPFVFPILVHDSFYEAYYIVPIFMLSAIFSTYVSLNSVIYIGLKKTKEVARTSIYSAIINIITHLFLIKFIGLYASAISTTVAFATMAFYRDYDLKKYVNLNFPKKLWLITAILYMVICVAYYSRNTLLQIIVLLCMIVVSFSLNSDMLKDAFKIFTKVLKRFR